MGRPVSASAALRGQQAPAAAALMSGEPVTGASTKSQRAGCWMIPFGHAQAVDEPCRGQVPTKFRRPLDVQHKSTPHWIRVLVAKPGQGTGKTNEQQSATRPPPVPNERAPETR